MPPKPPPRITTVLALMFPPVDLVGMAGASLADLSLVTTPEGRALEIQHISSIWTSLCPGIR
jgi:hypothetical protein